MSPSSTKATALVGSRSRGHRLGLHVAKKRKSSIEARTCAKRVAAVFGSNTMDGSLSPGLLAPNRAE
jgi:hypothetical protein